MPSSDNLWRGLLAPFRLRYQVLLLLASVLAVALVALYYISTSRLSEAARVTAQRWAEALAETAASASAEPLALKDYGALEATLRDIVALPGVLRIDVVESGGQPLLSLLTPPPASGSSIAAHRGAPAQVKYLPRDVPARPPHQEHGTYVTRLQGADVLQVWVAVRGEANLGTVGVTFSQEDERATLQRVQRESLLAIAAIGALTILIAYLFLWRALRPLQRLADFSANLSSHLGQRMEQPPGSREVAELTEALNAASVRLRGQLDELRASEARTQAALESLAERSVRLNAVFDLSPDGFALFDREEHLAFCNPALVQMTGWDALAGNPRLSLADFDQYLSGQCSDKHPYVPILGAAGNAAAATLTLERPAMRVLARIYRRNLDGQGESILYFRDITHQTEVDRIKSEFLSTAAHELRTPLASILGFSELLLNKNYDDATRRDLTQTVHNQSKLLVHLVNELLDLARIENRAGRDFTLRLRPLLPVIQSTVKEIHAPGDSRDLKCALPDALPLVEMDDVKIRQALMNVISNAFKYSPEGGAVEVSVVKRGSAGTRQVGIAVADHGIGMTVEHAARAFEKFFRADESGSTPGAGLGLALVKEIMEIHQGSAELQSKAGVGTTVTLWLPVKDAAGSFSAENSGAR